MNVKIVFENENFLVVDKPTGLVVHGDGRTTEDTLVDWLRELFLVRSGEVAYKRQQEIGRPHTLDNGRYVDRWGIVNRLDRDTSGLILIAKNVETFNAIQALFADKKIVKRYEALLWGEIGQQEVMSLLDEGKIFTTEVKDVFLINVGITRHKKDPRLWVIQGEEGSRQSVRDAETLIIFKDMVLLDGKPFTKVLFFPRTGRTHQLRLHSKYIGHPILGDKKYGYGSIDSCTKEDAENALQLRATGLSFSLFGETFEF